MRKKDRIDVIYIVRPQVERWTDEELRMNSNLWAARDELQKRGKSLSQCVLCENTGEILEAPICLIGYLSRWRNS